MNTDKETIDVYLASSNDSNKVTLLISRAREPLWYEFDFPYQMNLDSKNFSNMDFAAIALLPIAMWQRKNLRIHGGVSRELLDNLHRYQLIYASWLPGMCGMIEIIPDFEISLTRKNSRAIALASGGVDSSHMLLQHKLMREGRLTRNVSFACLLHGFDMPLHEEDGFLNLFNSVKIITDELDIPLIRCRSNWRHFCPDYEMFFVCGMASVLHQLSSYVGYGLIALDEPYSKFISSPWGSNYITNSLLSSCTFRFQESGGDFTRLQKVASIASHPNVLKNMRVCWQGRRDGKNCGYCEKCIRTQLELYAVDPNAVMPFDNQLDLEQIKKVNIHNPRLFDFYFEIIAMLESHNDVKSKQLIGVLSKLVERNPNSLSSTRSSIRSGGA